jgi:outer membrane receptor protein involved in Fe transport
LGDLDSRTQTGIRARAVPQGLNYRAFAKYALQSHTLKGLYLGGGFVKNPDRALDGADTATMPAYSTVDAFVGYEWGGRWRAQLNVTNVTDKVAPWIAVARQIIYPLEPRRAAVSLSYIF